MKKVILAVLLLITGLAYGQQTILNVPSSDVMGKGKAYVRFDTTHYPVLNGTTFTPNFVIGVGRNVEVGVNAEALSDPTTFSTTSIVPNVKWKFLERSSGDGKLELYIGDKIYVPVHNRSFRVGNYLYAAGAISVDTGLRLTAGVYNAQNVYSRGNRTGALLGIEQTVLWNKNMSRPIITLAGDWQSGRAGNGYLTGGAMIFPTSRLMVIPAYQIGNTLAGRNHGPTLFVGFKL
jgi:hypothetical protein